MLQKFWDYLSSEIEKILGSEKVADLWVAARFAESKHAGQVRLDGEPHFYHVLRVGFAAAEYALAHDFEPAKFRTLVLSAVLHDVLEDTPTTDEELAMMFGSEVALTVRALCHVEEEEPEEVYLSRVASGGKLAVLVKRFDRLDNLLTLAGTSTEFRAKKLTEITAALPIWYHIDPEGAPQIEAELKKLRKERI